MTTLLSVTVSHATETSKKSEKTVNIEKATQKSANTDFAFVTLSSAKAIRTKEAPAVPVPTEVDVPKYFKGSSYKEANKRKATKNDKERIPKSHR